MRRINRILTIFAMLIIAINANAWPWLSPYAYGMNNPVKYVDPDGRKIKIVGSSENCAIVLDLYNAGSSGKSPYSMSDGIISVENSFTPESFYDKNLCNIIASENCTSINVVSNDNRVIIGNAQTATIDVQDMLNLEGLRSTSPAAALFHETVEQSLVQNPAFRPDDNSRIIRAHSSAENMEHTFVGNIGVANILNIDSDNGNGTLEFYKDNKMIESVKITDNNVNKQ